METSNHPTQQSNTKNYIFSKVFHDLYLISTVTLFNLLACRPNPTKATRTEISIKKINTNRIMFIFNESST
jgi:hypothetical protein